MDTHEGRDPIRSGTQLRRDLRGGAPTLHRQQTYDHLQAVDEPVVEFLSQRLLALHEFASLLQQSFLARDSGLQIGHGGFFTDHAPSGEPKYAFSFCGEITHHAIPYSR